ncbi:efflux transporter outer membrane subunit [Acidithiobacillus sp. IBUN Pt1247-S3]|uniref:efflux transporter outer membrane subunit n=1 Tax=Acidithiobacillus sp. IBUN Pt1247-S3 TaxID=3166642 RepID=UPI0034E3B53E
MKIWHIAGWVLALLSLAACAPRMPQLAAPASLQDLQLSTGLDLQKSTLAATATWWQPLLNAEQQKILQLALHDNPDLAVAEGRVRLATAELRGAGAELAPQINAAGHVGVSRWTENQFYLPPYAGETSWNNSLKLDFSYNLDLWGKEKERVKEARLHVQVMEEKQRAATLVLENAALQQMLAISGNDAVLTQLQREQRILQQVENIERQREQHGLSDSLVALGTAARLSSLHREIDVEREKRQSNREALAVLCGQGTRLPMPLADGEMNLLQSGWKSPRQVLAEWIAQRPDVLARRSAIEAAAAAVHVARDAYYPNINIVAFAGGLAAAGALFTFLHPGSLQAGIGPAISLPLFTGGRLRGDFDASQANYQIALAQYRKSLLHALQQVAAALTALQAAQQERASLKQREAVLQRTEKLQQERYHAGLNNALPVLEAQLPVIDNQLQQIRLNTHAQQTLVNLYAALGGRVVANTWSDSAAGS